MSKPEVKVIDRGWNRIQQMFRANRLRFVAVGLIEKTNARSDSGLTNAQLGTIHEFGLGVPERSFLRSTFDKNQESWWRSLKTRAGMVLAGRIDPEETLDRMGAMIQGEVRDAIRAGIPPALAPATVNRKGSSKPLIDTGQLVQAITFEQRAD